MMNAERELEDDHRHEYTPITQFLEFSKIYSRWKRTDTMQQIVVISEEVAAEFKSVMQGYETSCMRLLAVLHPNIIFGS